MDWSLIVGSGLGAAIGLIGDWSGRLGARRQEERTRARVLEDATRQRALTIADEERREVTSRERGAAERIIRGLHDYTIFLLKPSESPNAARDHGDLDKAKKLDILLWYEGGLITNESLRNRIFMGAYAFGAAGGGSLRQFQLGEIAFIVRQALHASITAWLRGNDLPEMSTDWNRLRSALIETRKTFKEAHASERFDAWIDEGFLQEW